MNEPEPVGRQILSSTLISIAFCVGFFTIVFGGTIAGDWRGLVLGIGLWGCAAWLFVYEWKDIDRRWK
jgi:high-affinity Fe2+/Pb2+ permease